MVVILTGIGDRRNPFAVKAHGAPAVGGDAPPEPAHDREQDDGDENDVENGDGGHVEILCVRF